jgi:hypothetical protein
MVRLGRVYTKLRPTDSPSAVYAAIAERIPADVLVAFGPGIYRELEEAFGPIARLRYPHEAA